MSLSTSYNWRHAHIPGLDTRETAIAVWAVAAFTWAMTLSGVRGYLRSILTILTGRLILSVLLGAALWALAAVWFLRREGYWATAMLKPTIYWFVGIGLVTIFKLHEPEGTNFERMVRANLSVTAVVGVLMNLYTFPLPVELVLIPSLVMLGGVLAVSESDAQYAQVGKLVSGCLTTIGIIALGVSLVYLATHFGTVVNRESLRTFVLPLVLTVMFIPYWYVVAMWIAYQSTLHMTKWGLRERPDLYKFARWRILATCGFDVRRVRHFEREYRWSLMNAETSEEVTELFSRFRAARRQSQNGSG